MKPLKVLSLFDGISCGQVALERAGIPVEVYYASEIDKYAIEITQKNYPNTIQLGDCYELIKQIPDKSIDLEAFQNEMLAQMIRDDIREKTKNIRELILARAFSSTLISESPTYQPERNTVDINDILVD